MTNYYVSWGEHRIKMTWVPGGPLPPEHLVTSVHGFCFHNGKVLLVDLKHRGPDIPGGHREPGESAETCFRREALEEGYVLGGSCTLLGHTVIDHSENPAWQPGGKYPQIGYQVYYRMEVEHLLPFAAQHESARRFFVDPADAPQLHHNWHPVLGQILREALHYCSSERSMIV